MKQQSETFPSAIESIFLIIGLFIAEYLVAGLLYDLRSLSSVNPMEIWGVITVFGNGMHAVSTKYAPSSAKIRHALQSRCAPG